MSYMIEHFNSLQELYGEDAYIQMPNHIFQDLCVIKNKNSSTNIQQSSFAYAYLVTIAFLYKYAHFVDVDNGTYIQNKDIKQILGYGKTTKSIDHIIKKGGFLDSIGLTETTKNYPIQFIQSREEINGFLARDFITIDMIGNDYVNYNLIRKIVKNKNYEVKEPIFFFEYKNNLGTLYEYSNTHKITIKEFIRLIYDDSLDNIDFMMYCFFKSKCFGFKGHSKEIALYKISLGLGIGKDAFYNHLAKLKEKGYLEVNHKSFKMAGEKHDNSIEANEYIFKGVK
jgi:DNA-binding transcriptional ArsR family regulator